MKTTKWRLFKQSLGQLCWRKRCRYCNHFSLRKHTYSNILKISQPKKENFQIKNSDIFHISAQNIDCGYSSEPRPIVLFYYVYYVYCLMICYFTVLTVLLGNFFSQFAGPSKQWGTHENLYLDAWWRGGGEVETCRIGSITASRHTFLVEIILLKVWWGRASDVRAVYRCSECLILYNAVLWKWKSLHTGSMFALICSLQGWRFDASKID